MSEINKMLRKIGPNTPGNYQYVIWHAKKQMKRGRKPSAQLVTENGELIKNPRIALERAKELKTHAGVRQAVSNSYFNERMQRANRGEDIYAF